MGISSNRETFSNLNGFTPEFDPTTKNPEPVALPPLSLTCPSGHMVFTQDVDMLKVCFGLSVT